MRNAAGTHDGNLGKKEMELLWNFEAYSRGTGVLAKPGNRPVTNRYARVPWR